MLDQSTVLGLCCWLGKQQCMPLHQSTQSNSGTNGFNFPDLVHNWVFFTQTNTLTWPSMLCICFLLRSFQLFRIEFSQIMHLHNNLAVMAPVILYPWCIVKCHPFLTQSLMLLRKKHWTPLLKDIHESHYWRALTFPPSFFFNPSASCLQEIDPIL